MACYVSHGVATLRNHTIARLRANEKSYAIKLERLQEYRQIEDVYVVENADVGMTTTCAARLHHVLKTVKPAIGKTIFNDHILFYLPRAPRMRLYPQLFFTA